MIEALLQAERLLTIGMLDEAEGLFRRAADADPLNAMAVVGLARVASERGDDRAGYEHALAALAIDPQNALALRLEARLSEMLVARGEAVQRPPWIAAARAAGEQPSTAPRRSNASAEPAPPPRTDAESDAGRAAQQATFTRNPSMADHQRRMQARETTAAATTSEPPAAEPAADPAPPAAGPPGRPARRGLLSRLLGR